MFHSQAEAKRFFVEKVVAQAQVEGVPLSAAERRMLSWSESDPDFIVDPQLPEQLTSEISDEEYEKKVRGLFARSFGADVSGDPTAAAPFRTTTPAMFPGWL